MIPNELSDFRRLSEAERKTLDAICDQFEAAWRGKSRPDIRDFLNSRKAAEFSVFARQSLFQELLRLDVEHRQSHNDRLDESDYEAFSPEFQSIIVPQLAAVDKASDSDVRSLSDYSETLPLENLSTVGDESELAAGSEPVAGYRLISRIGKGGYGHVWSAEAPGGMRVALKFIPAMPKLMEPEIRSLQLVRDIRHPHVLETNFWLQLPEWLVLCSPLCDGSLDERLRRCLKEGRSGLPIDELLKYMAEAAEAIDFLNSPRSVEGRAISIQHRDIKPHNLLTSGGSIRVADLGLAKVLERSKASHSGAMTPAYAAPETFEGKTTPWSDQYSLAVTYYQLRCGHLPFRGSSAEVMHAHLYGEPDLKGLTAEEKLVVSRALAKVPSERWENCTTFVEQLEVLMGRSQTRHYRFQDWMNKWVWKTNYEPPKIRANRRKGRRAVVFALAMFCVAAIWSLLNFSAFAGMELALRILGIAVFGGLGLALLVAGLFNAITGEDCMGGEK